MINWTPYYDQCMKNGKNLIIYAGEYDQRDGPTTMYDWMNELSLLTRGSSAFWTQSRKTYYVPDGQGGFITGGYYRYDVEMDFTFLTIPKAGHFVPATNLAVTKQMLSDAISSHKLICHRDDPSKCEQAPTMCSYMNSCNGKGVCDWSGICKCNAGYKSADCSEKVELLSNGYSKQFKFNGTLWKYFQLEAPV